MPRLMSKIVIMLMVYCWIVFAQQSWTVSQYVRDWPAGYDVTGAKWVVYDLDDPEGNVSTQDSSNCYTVHTGNNLFWSADIGQNFWPSVPVTGDSLLSFGSWDSAYATSPPPYGDNPNHTGFYWIYTDTIIEDPDEWRDDTLRPLPKPIASQVGGQTGDIQISITNPDETRYTDQIPYSVLGFWIWADTTGAGTPDAFDAATVMEVGFFSVDGDTGGITICTHPVSNYHDGHTVYWAYKLVARPSFSLKGSRQAPGHTTHYFSQNSNHLVIIGIEENTNSKPECVKLEISPNPFTNKTDITCSIGQSAKSTELKIYDISGKLVKDFSHFTLDALRPTLLSWDGTDESGEMLPSGVYFVKAKGGDLNLTKKVILQRK